MRARSFTYDSLSRLLTSTNPETGTICYGTTSNQVPNASNCQPNGYDPNGNLIYRTDATGRTTSYQYDALNRMTFSFKPDGSSNGWGYDGNDENGNPIAGLTNSIGRLSHISNRVNAAENFGYDPMGRLNFQSACLPSACNYTTQVSALYDLAGNMTDLTYPDGHRAHFDIGADGRVKDVGDGTVTGNYAQSLLYNPDGSLGTLVYGNGSLQQVITQNNRLQVQSMAVTDPLSQNGTTYLAKIYCYVNCATGGSANNGNIWGITDALNGSRTQGFTYDNLNRISSFSLGGQLAQQYAIDSFGNMSGMVNGNATTTFDANNRISNLPCASSTAPYDAKGNQLCSTDQNGMVSQYVYDAENRISSINTLNGQVSPFVSYIYGADGQRVRKQDNNNGYTEYVSFNGQTIAEKDQNGTWTDYVFADGKRIAKVMPTSDPHLHIEGTATSGGSYYLFTFPIAPYTFKAGDRLVFRQYQTPGSRGGVNVVTTNGNYTAWYERDQDGQICNDDGVTGYWHNRSIDLSRLQGLQFGGLALSGDQGSSGHWSIDFADMAVVSTDGTVTTWYNGQDVTPSQIGGPGTQNPSSAFLTTPEPNLPGSTLFYVSDHLGSAAMEFASGGWPISSTQYAPFGAELPSNTFTANHYKFTGKERDAESGLDYFGARYYQSTSGRFMSSDMLNVTDDRLLLPSSTLNKYAYAANNPLTYVDHDGNDITVFYDPTGVTHLALVAYDPQKGTGTFESFAPSTHTLADQVRELFGADASGSVSDYKVSQFGSDNFLSNNYAALTIQTSPEVTQQVVQYINSHPDGNWNLYGNNCSDACARVLREIFPVIKGGTPGSVFSQLVDKYGSTKGKLQFYLGNGNAIRGYEYGNSRVDNAFRYLQLLSQHCETVTSKLRDSQGNVVSLNSHQSCHT